MGINNEAMTYEDMGGIYRVEKKSNTLMSVRRDLYPAMASLLISLRAEYDKQLSIDPDSLICDGADQRRKKATRLSKEIVELRMQKICAMALRGAMGAQNPVDNLTSEEKEYYNSIMDVSRKQCNILSRMTGRSKTESVTIDAPEPVKKPVQVKEEPPVAVPEPVVEETVPEEVSETADTEELPFEESEIIDEVIPIEDTTEPEDTSTLVILILEDLPPFAGPDRDYNLSKEDVVRMPKVMANVLINRQKAVAVLPTI